MKNTGLEKSYLDCHKKVLPIYKHIYNCQKNLVPENCARG
jgi:hypothetical protein